jgi:3-isopropylmalate/(R)-2-methylmalate dehydratase small subunit
LLIKYKAIATNPETELRSTFLNKQLRLKWLEKKNLLIFPDTKKANMINGFDDIDYLQNIKEK